MLEGVLLQRLKGIPNSIIDISKVIKFGWCKRMFCILDRDYPYKLWIEYNQPTTILQTKPIYTTNGGVAIITTSSYIPTQTLEARYKSEKDVVEDFLEIQKKQKQFEAYKQRLQYQIREDIKKAELNTIHNPFTY